MGLVEVHLYDLSVIEKWMKDVNPRIATIQNRAQQLAEQADKVAAEANQYAKRLIDDYRLEDHEFIAAVAKRADEANLVRKAAQAFFLITQSGVPYYGELPKERLLSTKTDADGNFSFDLPTGVARDYAVISFANRSIPGGEEIYFWAIKVSKDTRHVILSNDNLSSSVAPESLIQTLELDPEVAKVIGENADGIQRRIQDIISSVPNTPEPDRRTSAPTASPTPLPEFVATPPPQFVRLTDWFTLTDAKGREIKTLEPGKRLRVISRSADKVTIDYLGDTFSIPANVTESAK